jgi:hypothetical protein
MADFIEESIRIPCLHGGAALAPAQYQLTRRLAATGRLHPDRDVATPELTDQCTATLNFDTLRPLNEILRDYRRILERVYDPSAFAGRLQKLADMLDRTDRPRDLPEGDIRRKVASVEMVHKIITRLPEAREQFWQTFVKCAKSNPAALRYVVIQMALYLHLGPSARKVIAIDRRQACGSRPRGGGEGCPVSEETVALRPGGPAQHEGSISLWPNPLGSRDRSSSTLLGIKAPPGPPVTRCRPARPHVVILAKCLPSGSQEVIRLKRS